MRVREANVGDWPAIEDLVREARHTSVAVWERGAFGADEGCVVVEDGNSIHGVLLASADESPVAWVRLAAVGDGLRVGRWLDLSLPGLLSHLRALSVRELAWIDGGEWAGPYLVTRGFRALTEIVTLVKTDRHTPESTVPGIAVRAARRADSAAIAAIDRAAFTPYWWRSEASVRRRAARASNFAVAESSGRVVGYAEWESRLPAAHLNRIAVYPDEQGRGIGAHLLGEALRALWDNGVEEVSLNTQKHNRRARCLYEDFGFEPSGDAVSVWTLQLRRAAGDQRVFDREPVTALPAGPSDGAAQAGTPSDAGERSSG